MMIKQGRLIVGLVFVLLLGFNPREPGVQATEQSTQSMYYCPMHPNVTSDRPGLCPICNMNLVKRKERAMDDKHAGHTDHSNAKQSPKDYASVVVDGHQRQLMGIRTAMVKKEQTEKMVHAVGYVAHNVDLYKVQNEFVEAYQEYVNVYRDYKRISNRRRNWEVHRDLQTRLLEAEHNLVILGLGPMQIEKLRNIKWWQSWDQPGLEIFKDYNNYWIFAQVFERDLGFVEVGQQATIDIPAYHETLKGIVRSIGGYVDPQTRTVRVLIEIEKYRGELTANMLGYVKIHSELGEHLTVPFDAVSDLGDRKIVFVARQAGVYDPVEVEVVFQGDGYWAINKGLKENDMVVVDGNFLLDSESRLRSQLDSLNDASGNEVPHVH